MKARILALGLLIFLFGIFIGSYIAYEKQIFQIISLILLLVFVFWAGDKVVRLLAFLGLIFLFGIFWYNYKLPQNHPDWIGNYTGKSLTLKGIIDKEPEASGKSTKLVIKVTDVAKATNVSEVGKKATGKLFITTKNYPKYGYGDYVEIKGELQSPENFEEFNYKDYLLTKGIGAVMDYPEITISDLSSSLVTGKRYAISNPSTSIEISKPEQFWLGLNKNLISIKQKFESVISQVLPEPQAGFMEGLLLGTKKKISDDLLDIFSIVGITHVIALSGFNITVIARALEKTTFFLSRNLAFLIPTVGIFSFVILTGGSASVTRAAIMGFMFILARRLGRPREVTAAILLAAAIMIFINPLILRSDISFQLSFAATLGLIFLSPIFDHHFARLPLVVREPISLTLSAQLAALPIIVYQFHQLSIISPLSNLLILPFIPFCMFLGFLAGFLGIVFLPLGKIFGYLSWAFLNYFIRVAEHLSRFSFSSFNIYPSNFWWLSLYYLFIICMIIFYRKRLKVGTAGVVI